MGGLSDIPCRFGEVMPPRQAGPTLLATHVDHAPCIAVYLEPMLSDNELLARILDRDLIGFLTAVDPSGQPQTAPVWFVRDGDDIVVYNRPDTPRLSSIAVNPKVALTLRGDRRGMGGVSIEASATRDDSMPSPQDFPGYLDKYRDEIELIGYTPQAFSVGYGVGVRLVVTRVRAFGLEHFDV